MSRGKHNKDYQVGNLLITKKFWDEHREEVPSGCIEWRGATHRQGYGMINAVRLSDEQAIMTVTHRVAIMEATGKNLTSQDFIINTCDNKLCCNPAHYFIGDYSDRTQMMKMRGRVGLGKRGPRITPPKKQVRNYKYTEEEIQWVRLATPQDIAERYNIDSKRAGCMRHLFRNGYKWLPMPETK
jgi:hypothetical protein